MDRRTFWKNKYIKEHAEYMARTHTGIDDTDLLRLQGGIFLSDSGKLRLHLWLLLGLIQIIFPFGF